MEPTPKKQPSSLTQNGFKQEDEPEAPEAPRPPLRKVTSEEEPQYPYAVKNLDKDNEDVDLSPADAITTWLYRWDPDLVEQFLDIEDTKTLWIEQRDEPEVDGVPAVGTSTPLLSVERLHDEIRIKYFDRGNPNDKAEYRANIDEETGKWTPLGATISGQRYPADDPMIKMAASLITSRILYDEPWKTSSKSTMDVRFG